VTPQQATTPSKSVLVVVLLIDRSRQPLDARPTANSVEEAGVSCLEQDGAVVGVRGVLSVVYGVVVSVKCNAEICLMGTNDKNICFNFCLNILLKVATFCLKLRHFA
jgi:hypothetical protein